jgi:uncharacterized membrane protein
MTPKIRALAAAAGSLFVLAAGAGAADKPPMEKCYGVAKPGQNDCAGNRHSCAGQSKEQSDKEWILVPKGTCDRLAGGSTTPGK